jgi:YVTN family beta-propeller protein
VEFVNASTFAVGRMVGASVTPSDVVVNRSGTKAYVSAVNGDEVTVVDVASGTKLSSFRVTGSARVLLSRDGSTLYVGRNRGLDVFSTATGTRKASLSFGTQVNGLAISRDGSVLYASDVFSGKVWRFATATMTATDSIETGGQAQDIVLHEPSGKVYVANESGWVDVLSASHVARITRFNTTPDAFAMGLTSDGAKLYVSGSSSGSVYVLDCATGSVIKTVSVGGTPRRIAFLPDGRALVANEGGWIDVVK